MQMSTVSDSSQEASNAGIIGNTTSAPPQIFLKGEMPDLQAPNLFANSSLLKTSTSVTEQAQKRRSSSRSIKRKKFDDELVESSLIKTSRAKPQNVPFPILPSTGCIPSSIAVPPNVIASTSQAPMDTTIVLPLEKKKPQRSQKRIKKPKSNQAHLSKDISRWKPTDDLALILSVQQTNNLETVYRGVKFSNKFTLREVEERWYSLLYDAGLSKSAVYAMKQLNSEVISQIQAKVLFSVEEEKLIASVSSTQGSIEAFEKLLDANTSVFLPARTAKVLYGHWAQMKQYNLLQDQTFQQDPNSENLLSLSDAEEVLDDDSFLLAESKDSVVDEEIQHASRKALYEIKQIENELPRYQALVEQITGVSIPDFDSKTLAVLRGRIVRYLIQSKEVTLGRSSKETSVDIDLSLEGPACKISRKQGSIKMDNNGEFYIVNEGKKPVFVDGKPVLSGNKSKINTNSIIEITLLRFIFIVNQEAISALKAKNNS